MVENATTCQSEQSRVAWQGPGCHEVGGHGVTCEKKVLACSRKVAPVQGLPSETHSPMISLHQDAPQALHAKHARATCAASAL